MEIVGGLKYWETKEKVKTFNPVLFRALHVFSSVKKTDFLLTRFTVEYCSIVCFGEFLFCRYFLSVIESSLVHLNHSTGCCACYIISLHVSVESS